MSRSFSEENHVNSLMYKLVVLSTAGVQGFSQVVLIDLSVTCTQVHLITNLIIKQVMDT